jgi:hypothetical protein
MNTRSLCVKFVLAISLVFAGHGLWAQDGIEGALQRANLASPLNLSEPFGRTLAAADFDNDQKLDGAVLVDSGRFHGQNAYRLELHLSGSANTELTFGSAESALAITASDVNKDGATDVVVEQPLTHKRLYIWLGDGHGGLHTGRIEDFPSDGNAAGEQFDVPSSRLDYPAACLAPPRGTETAKLAARSLPGLPPSSGEFKPFSESSSPMARSFSVNSSRAPPSITL